jgi:hypothetical protein
MSSQERAAIVGDAAGEFEPFVSRSIRNLADRAALAILAGRNRDGGRDQHMPRTHEAQRRAAQSLRAEGYGPDGIAHALRVSREYVLAELLNEGEGA